jgi:tripartite-type tricarboxylate transporter receptor subunit TctC
MTRDRVMRSIVALQLVLSALMAFPAAAEAQQPLLKRSVNLYVGFAAGGPADVLARLISEKLKDHIGQSVIVSSYRTGRARAARSPPPP